MCLVMIHSANTQITLIRNWESPLNRGVNAHQFLLFPTSYPIPGVQVTNHSGCLAC